MSETQLPPDHGNEQRIDDAAVSKPIADTRRYLETALTRGRASKSANLDRSQFFRYKQDVAAVRDAARETMKNGEPLKMLIIGIGNGEEPLSYLSAVDIEAQKEGKALRDVVDLEMVELRPREQVDVRYGLGQRAHGGVGAAFLTPEQQKKMRMVPIPPQADLQSAFELDAAKGEYVFRKDIRETLEAAFEDERKTRFATPVENFVDESTTTYDVVACNNVLQHLGGIGEYASPFRNPGKQEEDYTTFVATLRGVLARVKPGGKLVLHTDGADISDRRGFGTAKALALIPDFESQFEMIETGIYRRRDV